MENNDHKILSVKIREIRVSPVHYYNKDLRRMKKIAMNMTHSNCLDTVLEMKKWSRFR